MVEKKNIVYDLMYKYNGPFSVEEFYEVVEDWIKERGLEKELKRKSEEVARKGKRVEWIIECWRSPVRAYKQIVKMRAQFEGVKEVKVKRKGKTLKFNQGDVFILIDGWLETSLTSRWTQNPIYYFFRTLYDKYIWLIADRFEPAVEADCYDLHKRLKSFFELYKMKVS